MFLDQPGEVSGQYGTVTKKVGDKIFKVADKPIIYYVSALAYYKIDNLFKTGKLDKKYRRSRYHAMMLFRIIASSEEMPRFNTKKMEAYCQNLLDILNDNSKCERYFSAIVDYIVSVGDKIKIEDRKCFEKIDTAKYFKTNISDASKYVKSMVEKV